MSEDSQRDERRGGHYHEYPIVHGDEERSDLKWIGVGAPGYGVPQVYDPHQDAVYEGEIDEEEGRIRVSDERRRELGESEALGDHIASTADEHGWQWLSEFAHDHMDTTSHEAGVDVVDREFDRRNVASDDDYDLGFFGSTTYRDDDGRVHVLEREFEIFTDGPRLGEGGRPAAVVDELFLAAEEPREEERAGDAELETRTREEITLDVDPDAGTGEIRSACEEFHDAHPRPVSSTE